MLPERSEAAKAALDIFFEGVNDVHFYVEDTDQKNLYKVFLGRFFPGLNLSQIFPLDGKPNVLRHAQDNKNNSVIRTPRVYILDKDFDDILGIIKNEPNIFYLQKYCIENYVLEAEAVIDFIIESAPKTDRVSLSASLQYEQFLRKSIRNIEPLFRLFCLVQKHGLGLPNSKQPPERFVYDNNRDELDPHKVLAYRNTVENELRARSLIANNEDLEKLCNAVFSGKRICAKHVSGKFLLKFVQLHLKKNKHIGNVTDDVMLFSLARNAKARPLRELGTRIRRYLRSVV